MKTVAVPQVEFISGNTPQETAALFNARMVELRFNNPTFERTEKGFWVTYNKAIGEEPKIEERKSESADDYPRCSECPYYEHVDNSVKWGRCHRYGDASVNRRKRVCTAYWKIGGDELDA